MTLDLDTVDTLNRCSLSEMEKVGHSLNPQMPDSCGQFRGHVKKVEAALIYTYGLVSFIAVHRKDPFDAANLWKQMSAFCEAALTTLREMKDRFPYCGTPEVYDMALDYKIASDEKYQQNLRDSECLSLPIPGRFFPKKS